ncbi:ATP-dependent helicase/nuclease subunit A [Rhizoctonia solani]|uniref:ATP-dependent helicase/nuclease subunit A n=1 Tax=Rhizoctonia solani TaxID=456999 RepID=A0A0K6GII9_9AGAM|nr:ATP-dependent helicase/nuclease subunit A [Rhizoctonia solani]
MGSHKNDLSAREVIKLPDDLFPNTVSIAAKASGPKSPEDIIEPYYRPIYDPRVDRTHWIQIVADFVILHCPEKHQALTISLLPDHPLVVTIVELLRRGLSIRSIKLLDRVYQGRRKVGQRLSALFFSPGALEVLVDAALEFEAPRLFPLIARELSRTYSTQPGYDSALTRRLIIVYEKLMDAYYRSNDPQSVLSLYYASYEARVPTSQLMFKRTVQSLFKQFLRPTSDHRRYSIPRAPSLSGDSPPQTQPKLNSDPPIDGVLEQLRRILNHMASENLVPNSRLLADIFRGLGAILKLETQGVEVELSAQEGQSATHEIFGVPAPRYSTPAFRLESLALDESLWLTVGRIISNTLGRTLDPGSSRRPGDEGRTMLLMAWADVMLSLREDVADAIARATSSRPKLKALSNRVNELLATNQAWNYQRTFDRLALASSLRPHHENSFGELGSELDPALDLPVGPAPGQWPISRTLNEAQRVSLLIRDRLVEGDSVAALLHFHSLASLCGAFRRLCASVSPENAPSLFTHSSGNGFQRPPEVVLAEVRQELEMRVESVYVRLAGHALRTGDSSYVNDVLELAYTLPPRDNKRTFSRVWKRAMSAFVRWGTEWYGSGGIGRAFRTLVHLLGIGPEQSSAGNQNESATYQAIPRAVTHPSRALFDLSWLRDQQSWPYLGRNVFARRHVISALIEKAEETAPIHLQPGSNTDTKTAARHLQDPQRLAEEAKVREALRQMRANHPRSPPRSTDQCPSSEGAAGTHARTEAHNLRGDSGDHTQSGDYRTIGYPAYHPQDGTVPLAVLVGVLGALKVPMAASDAERLGYDGPRHECSTQHHPKSQEVDN